VILGENGTGKTHILKACYAMSKTANQYGKIDIEDFASMKIKRLFMPIQDKIGKLRRQGSAENSKIEMVFHDDDFLQFSFHTNSKQLSNSKLEIKNIQALPLFIPSKEILSFMKGFNSLYEQYAIAFDQSYHDLCLCLDLPEIRSEILDSQSKWVIAEIEKICRGKFIFHGGGVITFKSNQHEYSINSVAEGFRKIAVLSRLLQTGSLQLDQNQTLYWDEPEANLNPNMMRLVVQILIALSQKGVQIVLATHDYVFLKWLSLLGDPLNLISYHALKQKDDGLGVCAQSVDKYEELTDLAIEIV
jgi:AAA15 family ATPase/GTPase